MKPGPKPKVSVQGDIDAPSEHVPRGQLHHADAKKFWRKIAPELIDIGLLTAVDVPAFLMLCEHYAVAMAAAEVVAQQGPMREDENGVERKHPMLQILRDNSKAFRMYCSEFGMTPSSRQRIDFEAAEEGDALAELLFRRAFAAEVEGQA